MHFFNGKAVKAFVVFWLLFFSAIYCIAGDNNTIFNSFSSDTFAITPEVSTNELKRIVTSGSGIVIDVRPYDEYAISHIPGAVNIWEEDIESRLKEIVSDKNSLIVTYCNGIFCGKSLRVAKKLMKLGYRNARRYQLGIPVWRAAGFPCEISPLGVKYIYENDKTAWFIDARAPEQFRRGTIPGAKNVSPGEVKRAKKDGRVPYHDHNTRIVVFGDNEKQAKTLAEELCHNAFHNVAYYPGTFQSLKKDLALTEHAGSR